MHQAQALEDLLDRLGYSGSPGLKWLTDGDIPRDQHFLRVARAKLKADAVFCVEAESGTRFPVVLFCSLAAYEPGRIAEIHRLAWNSSTAPLLVVVLPGQVRVYTCYKPGIDERHLDWDPELALVDHLDLSARMVGLAEQIDLYHRTSILTGRTWSELSEHFTESRRVDQMLLANLRTLRERLSRDGLESSRAHALIGRCILVSYLEQRQDSEGFSALPRGFFGEFWKGAERFVDVLENHDATYRLFDHLARKFNGDVFPVLDDEVEEVTDRHLRILREFLSGGVDMATGQRGLWPFYSFDVIPIELISSIYESFLGTNKRAAGAYYTPTSIVSFMMDQLPPLGDSAIAPRILDPACGSGAFLVEAYRRLVDSRIRQTGQPLTAGALKQILTDSIFGVDKMADAVRIAALSLYLTMCDYLEPRHIWTKVRFPALRGTNLFDQDFFTVQLPHQFDVIVGNPPWKSDLTPETHHWLREHNRPFGDKQMAQAFVWKCLEHCRQGGSLCLLVPKGIVFNISGRNQEFQSEFLKAVVLKRAINFSLMRFGLFSGSVAPGIGLVFEPAPADGRAPEGPVIYFTPKPTGVLSDEWAIPVRDFEISQICQRRLREDRYMWKAAMWGSPRDVELIERLREFPSLLKTAEEHEWIHGEGFIKGDKDIEPNNDDLVGMPLIHPNLVQRFWFGCDLPRMPAQGLYRSASTKREIFRAPHLLLKQSPGVDCGFVSAVLDYDAVFPQTIVGIHVPEADKDILAAVCVILNSDLAVYYAMLTSSRWLVERSELAKAEAMAVPIPSAARFSFDALKRLSRGQHLGRELNDLVGDWFGLSRAEKQLIANMIAFELDYYRRRHKSIGFTALDPQDLKPYLETLSGAVTDSFSRPFSVNAMMGTIPYTIVTIRPSESAESRIFRSDSALESNLKAIDARMGSTSVLSRSTTIIYEGDAIYIAKPSQRYFWTTTRALQDADRVYADIMSEWAQQY